MITAHAGTDRVWHRARAWLVALAASCLCAPASVGVAQSNVAAASERSVKAAFLYKFAEYVDWSTTPVRPSEEPFTIGVLGAGALADDLLRMTADRTLDNRPISVRRVSANDGIDDLQVLFIAGEQRGRLEDVLSSARGRPILTVTEAEGALTNGSIINFTMMGDRLRFEVSLDAAQSSRLRLSSRLLAVAANVIQTP